MNQSASAQISESVESELPQWLGPALCGGIIVALVLVVFQNFFWSQLQWAIRYQADWGHTLLIPFISAYFIYLNREKLLAAAPFRTAWVGLVPVVVGIGWYMFCVFGPPTLNHHNLHASGVAMTLFGLVLLFFGFRGTMLLLFPLVYLVVFGQTISERFMDIITFRLQDIAARGSYVIFVLIGMDVERGGNIISVFDNGEEKPLNIAEACSGMRMLMAFLALGVAMAYVGLKRIWQRVLLVLLAVPTAIFVNMLRVVTLGILSLYDAEFAAGDFETFVGLVWLIPAFLILLGLMWGVKQLVIEPSSDGGVKSTDKAIATKSGQKGRGKGAHPDADGPRSTS